MAHPTPLSTCLPFERPLGATELSYYLPSRADGVNDMYLHLVFRAPAWLMSHARLRAVWAHQRLVHGPLAAQVHMLPGVYSSARFLYSPPRSAHRALVEADASLEFRVHARGQGKDTLIEEYLNGPRSLSDHCLARLVLASAPISPSQKNDSAGLSTPASTPGSNSNSTLAHSVDQEVEDSDTLREYDLLLCAVHFLGDGMALHRLANEIFTLLAARDKEGQVRTTDELEALVKQEWDSRWGVAPESGAQTPGRIATQVLPPALEDALPKFEGRYRRVAGRIDFECNQKKAIGAHSFPRAKHPTRRTIVPTISFDEKKTKAILKRCKDNGVSIANAMFALNALAWSQLKGLDCRDAVGRELPIMMYTALNLRPFLLPLAIANTSYWITAIGYLNVILPSFLPSLQDVNGDSSKSTALRKTFWHRARDAKRQIGQGSKHPLLVSRTHEMARMRAERACVWAREDDERAAGIWSPQPKTHAAAEEVEAAAATKPWVLPPAPSAVLMGLSLLGNLDSTYMHASFPDIALHTLTTGSRQRHGASLLFAYTFCGRLWLSLGYDVNGFADGMMEQWWDAVLRGVDDLLVN